MMPLTECSYVHILSMTLMGDPGSLFTIQLFAKE